jgi:hypothetical protein
MAAWKKRTRSATKPDLQRSPQQKRRKTDNAFEQKEEEPAIPLAQSALFLHAVRQPYSIGDHSVPSIHKEVEVLIRVEAAGLNPIDWKAP